MNEFIITFSVAKDTTSISNRKPNRFKDIPFEYDADDFPVSFKKQDGSIDWDAFDLYRESKPDKFEKDLSSIYRAKNTIYDLMQSNTWQYFVTLTVDAKKPIFDGVNVKDVSEVQKIISNVIKRINNHSDIKMKYLLIPEYQENGNVHFHGVVSGIDKELLVKAINNQPYLKDEKGNLMTDKNGNRIENKYFGKPLVRKGNQVWNHTVFNDIGYNDFEEIRDMARVGSYCTKYVTKELLSRINEFGAHLYICSKNLERKKEVYRKYVNDYPTITNNEIKEKLSDKAFIKRSDYAVKIFINKRYKKKEDVFSFIDHMDMKETNRCFGYPVGNKIRSEHNFIKQLNDYQRRKIGILAYNDETGEIKYSEKRQRSFRNLQKKKQERQKEKFEQTELHYY